ncbi:putative UDP-glucose,sterol transferase [Microdochium bolleyi]|uniref:Putative UDP-glucose,sterol transferase n=1 Tax=Microdochium bolleyi TaxID=196109 RepID=A0A136IZT5_9PEZI|nr:putative UDP-glucose,sterol transferase [Microdochium bolleyi]
MSLHRVRSETPGHVTIGSGLTRTSTAVGSDGRTAIHFHRTPQELAARVGEFLAPYNPDALRKACASRRPSVTTALGDDNNEKPALGPRLNIAIHIVGSRGDVQPFIPIAQLLSSPPYNHRVRICTHPVFKDFVESKGIEFFSIGGDPEALMAYMVKNPGLLPSMESFKAGEVGKRRKEMAEILEGTWRSCIEPRRPAGGVVPGGRRPTASDITASDDLFVADAIIANPPSMGHIHCAEKLGIPLHMVFTMPWSPTRAFHHPLASMQYGQSEAGVANFMSFIVMELLTWQGLGDIINKFRAITLKLDPISPLWGNQLLTRLRVPYTYLWSESLIPKPEDWGTNINVAGFAFMKSPSSYTPPPDLAQFLASGPPPIYIGFGSIVVDDPEALTQMIFQAVEKAGVRAIVSRGWGKIGGDDIPDSIYMVGDCPHDWLFERVSCVVHHGGAGTTAAGIAAGCPTVVVPFFGDQPFWGQMIANAGAGPPPAPFKTLTADILAEKIEFALRPEAQEAARRVAENVAREDGAQTAVKDIQDRLTLANMSCDLCPDQVAVWEHKKTGAHLSTLAVLCLIDHEVIKVDSIKLLRHTHWYVYEGAESPILGGVVAFAYMFACIGYYTKCYADRLKAIQQSRKAPDPETAAFYNDKPSIFASGPGDAVAPRHMEKFAKKVASKSHFAATFVSMDHGGYEVSRDPVSAKPKRGRADLTARASGRYALNVGKSVLKFPGNFFYNVANGFRNFPSYLWHDIEPRRRDEVTGLRSGLKVSGKEFGVGVFDAVTGLVVLPYKGARRDGAKGLGKGVAQGLLGVPFNIFSAVYGLPGYTLKGVEKELHKRHMTQLKAEIIMIRLKQGSAVWRDASEQERGEVVARWRRLYPGKGE